MLHNALVFREMTESLNEVAGCLPVPSLVGG
jgi:hypothetical protein